MIDVLHLEAENVQGYKLYPMLLVYDESTCGCFFSSTRKLLCSECVFAADKIGEDYLINETEFAG